MFTKYFRKESTTDELLNNQSFSVKERKQLSKKMDVVSYKDADCTVLDGRWMWYYKSKPSKNAKKLILCGMICEIVWLPDLIIEREIK